MDTKVDDLKIFYKLLDFQSFQSWLLHPLEALSKNKCCFRAYIELNNAVSSSLWSSYLTFQVFYYKTTETL